MTIVTFTRLLAISNVANRRSGASNRSAIMVLRGLPSIDSSCSLVIEKNANSDPEIKADINRANTVSNNATQLPVDRGETSICCANNKIPLSCG